MGDQGYCLCAYDRRWWQTRPYRRYCLITALWKSYLWRPKLEWWACWLHQRCKRYFNKVDIWCVIRNLQYSLYLVIQQKASIFIEFIKVVLFVTTLPPKSVRVSSVTLVGQLISQLPFDTIYVRIIPYLQSVDLPLQSSEFVRLDWIVVC